MVVILLSCASENITNTEQIILKRIKYDISQSGNYKNSDVSQYLNNIDRNGKWNDIDYKDTSRTAWKPLEHLERTLKITLSLSSGDSQSLKKDAICKLLDFYNNYTYKSPACLDRETGRITNSANCHIHSRSWWYNTIGEGLFLGKILVLMKGEFPDSFITCWSKRIVSDIYISHNPLKVYSGANFYWEGETSIYKSIAASKYSEIDTIIRLFQNEENLLADGNGKDGVREDNSFNQHGFLQTGSYGQGYLEMVAKWIRITDSTPLQWGVSRRKRMIDFLLEGCVPLVDHNEFDPGSLGRDISRSNNHTADILQRITREWQSSSFQEYRKSELAESEDYLKRGIWPWPQKRGWIFPSNSFLIYHGDNWTFSWHGCSKGMVGSESFDGENLYGELLPLGCYWLRSVNFNYKLMPALDWNHLPGTVLPQNYHVRPASFKTNDITSYPQLQCNSDSCSIDYMPSVDGTHGHQKIILKNDSICVYGEDFSTDSLSDLVVVVNQLIANKNVLYCKNGKIRQLIDSVENISSLCVNGDSYFFPDSIGTKANISSTHCSWNTINRSMPKSQYLANIITIKIIIPYRKQRIHYFYIIKPSSVPPMFQSAVQSPH